MKTFIILSGLLLGTTLNATSQSLSNSETPSEKSEIAMKTILRHIVLFKFKEDATAAQIKRVEKAFTLLPSQIKEIVNFEWGLNNSPEQLNKDFTHSFVVTFKTEDARGIYLVHPDHLKFVEILKPHLDDVLVIDYWTK